MKTQTKAIIASAVVIVLALSAVAGVTYSWFSDTEEATVNVNTAKVDYDVKFEVGKSSSTIGSITGSGNSFSIENMTSHDEYTIIDTSSVNNSTIRTVYRVYVQCSTTSESTFNDSDAQNIAINGISFKGLNSTVTVKDWTSLDAKSKPDIPDITITVLDGISQDRSGLQLKVFVDAYQGNYVSPVTPTIKDNSVSVSDVKVGPTGETAEISVSGLPSDANEKEITLALAMNDANSYTVSASINGITTFENPVSMTIVIPGDVSGANVIYLGTSGEQPSNISVVYDVVTDKTTVKFSTTHFSEFMISKDVVAIADVENGVGAFINLSDAFANVKSGGIVKLVRGVTLESTIAVIKNVELDLNEKTISNVSNIWDKSSGDWSLISVRENGNLTIIGNGTLQAKVNDCYAVDVQDGAICTIKGGEYIGNAHAVYVEKGNLYVEGGKYSVQQKYLDAAKADEFVLNCYDANRTNGTAKISVSGGVFVNFNPADCWAEGEHTNFLVSGYAVTEVSSDSDRIYTVVPAVAEVVKSDGNKYYYSSLEDAFAASNDKNATKDNPVVINVLNDCSGNGIVVSSGNNIRVDFNNCTYTMNGSPVGSSGTESIVFQLLRDSNITFENGTLVTVENPRYKMLIQNYCNLTLDNMVIDGSNIVADWYTMSNNNGTILIKDTIIIPPKNGVAFDVYGKFSNYDGPTVTVSGTSSINGIIEVSISNNNREGTVQCLIIGDEVTFSKLDVKGVVNGVSIKVHRDVYDANKVSVITGYEFTLEGDYYILTKSA